MKLFKAKLEAHTMRGEDKIVTITEFNIETAEINLNQMAKAIGYKVKEIIEMRKK
jgi:hypothetical protein